MHGCGSCGGLWVGNELARRLLSQLEPEAIALADLASEHARPFPPVAKQPACPVCQTAMRRITVAGTNVEIDLCDTHGTWFDREELQVVARFFEEQRRAAQNFPPPMRFDPADYAVPQDEWRGWVSRGSAGEDAMVSVLGKLMNTARDSKNDDDDSLF